YAELASKYDLDGLHLDRVRYAWQEWGYNPTSLARFQAQTGRPDVPEPADAQWLQWRRDQVTALVRKIYLTVTAIDPQLRVSAALSAAGGAPFTDADWLARTPYAYQLQDWRSWLEEGIVDLGLTMTYKSEDLYPLQFDNWIAWQKDHQYGRGVVVGTGLYLNSVEDSMSQWLRARQPSPLGNHALGISGYSYGTPSSDGTPRRSFVNAAVTDLFTQTAHTPFLGWKDAPDLGHLMGSLVQVFPCPGMYVDGYPLSLSGPANRQLRTDGNGWFGAVDLPPGRYQLSVNVLNPTTTIQVPVDIIAGAITERSIYLPGCATHRTYLPLILKQAVP
ncbi:MAG: family 10 glycosylhydrolase, partial [Anaerolineae bacterium]